MKTIIPILVSLTMLAGCYGSTGLSGSPDGSADVHVDPPADSPGDTTPPGCTVDSECIVADPFDCCNGCPIAIDRRDLTLYPCHYERGTTPPEIPMECMIDCYACPVCYPQPLDAVCRGGACVAGEQGCPYTGEAPVLDSTIDEVYDNRMALSGSTVRLRGAAIPRFASCDDICPAERCCSAEFYLGGLVRLEGSPCEAYLECWKDDYCSEDWDCGPLEDGRSYEVVGELRSGSYDVSVYVEAIREVEPAGLDGLFMLEVLEVMTWADDPGVDCERYIVPGDVGRMSVATSPTLAFVQAPVFRPAACLEFEGTSAGSSIEARVPIDCDDCCCDWEVDVLGPADAPIGNFRYYDGMCHTDASFRLERI